MKGRGGKKKVGGRWGGGAQGLHSLPPPSLFATHDFFSQSSRSDVALHRASSSSFNEEFGLLLVSPLERPRRFYAIRRRSRVLLHPRSRIFLTIHRKRRSSPRSHRERFADGGRRWGGTEDEEWSGEGFALRLSRNGEEMEYYIRGTVMLTSWKLVGGHRHRVRSGYSLRAQVSSSLERR